METTVYLDILFLLNFFVTYLLVNATARIMNIHTKKRRIFFGALLGGVYSLLILFDLNNLELIVIKILMGASLVFTVFFHQNEWRRFLKTGLCFFVVNFVFAGFMIAVWLFFPAKGMQYKNGVAYFDISALTLALSTAAAYLIITLFTYILNKRTASKELIELRFSFQGREISLMGFTDSGNKLCDIFSGLPVIVCEYQAAESLFPEKIKGFFENPGGFSFEGLAQSSYQTMFRIIPITMAAGQGALPAFKPDRITINGAEKEAVVAITKEKLSDGGFQAILNPALL